MWGNFLQTMADGLGGLPSRARSSRGFERLFEAQWSGVSFCYYDIDLDLDCPHRGSG